MKKLVKWTLILGIVLCFLGTGVMTAGAVMGGIHGVGTVSYTHLTLPTSDLV